MPLRTSQDDLYHYIGKALFALRLPSMDDNPHLRRDTNEEVSSDNFWLWFSAQEWLT